LAVVEEVFEQQSGTSVKEEILVIEPGSADRHYWRDLWAYRELFLILAWRDVAVRYKQTLIGIVWALLKPFLTMLVLTVVFSKLAKLPSEGTAPYALMVFAGMLPWYLFSSALGGAAESIVGSANLIGRVYFPRMIVPTASIVVALIDFLVSSVILAILMAWYRFVPGWHVLLLPFFVLLALLASLGPGLLISALNAKYRDFRFVIPFILQFGLYISPVGFSSSVVPDAWRLVYSLNPMVGIIDGFRWCLLGGTSGLYLPGFCASLAAILLFLWIGLSSFRATEKSFADLL
jgi:lipopolysaccharide transport system permease protein